VSVYGQIQDAQDAAAVAFGAMLRRWRIQNGWTQYTAGNWAKESGNRSIPHSGVSELERGMTKNPRIESFLNLGNMNLLIHQQDWTGVKSPKLKLELEGSRAITDPDGNPWGAAEFWACRAGLLEPPAWLAPPISNPAPVLTSRQAEDLCLSWAAQARRVARQTGAGRRGLDQLRQMAPVVDRRIWADVLAEQATWTPEELAGQWDAEESEWIPALWLSQWAAALESEEEAAPQ